MSLPKQNCPDSGSIVVFSVTSVEGCLERPNHSYLQLLYSHEVNSEIRLGSELNHTTDHRLLQNSTERKSTIQAPFVFKKLPKVNELEPSLLVALATSSEL